MSITPDTQPADKVSLLRSPYRAFALSAVCLVTMGALENRATSTVLPTVAENLDGLGWFGAALAAPGLAYLIGAPIAGLWADRRGARRPLLVGMVAFFSASVLIAASTSMAVVVGARLVTGFAEAFFDIALTVMIAARLPERFRPRLMAWNSAAWLLPSVLGPQAAGWAMELWGWRWVFLGCALLIIPLGIVLARPAEQAVLPERAAGSSRTTLRAAFLGFAAMAVMTGLTAVDGGVVPPSVIIVIAAALGVGTLLLVRRLNPPGLLRLSRGLPAVIGLAALISTVFEVTSAYLPLYVQRTRGLSPAAAGTVMTITGICWAIGSWLQSSTWAQQRTSPAARIRAAFVLVTIGCCSLITFAVGTVPLAVPFVGWALAGVGIGIGTATLTVHRINLTPMQLQGRTTAGANLLTNTSATALTILLGLGLGMIPAGLLPASGRVVLGAFALLGLIGIVTAYRVLPARPDSEV